MCPPGQYWWFLVHEQVLESKRPPLKSVFDVGAVAPTFAVVQRLKVGNTKRIQAHQQLTFPKQEHVKLESQHLLFVVQKLFVEQTSHNVDNGASQVLVFN